MVISYIGPCIQCLTPKVGNRYSPIGTIGTYFDVLRHYVYVLYLSRLVGAYVQQWLRGGGNVVQKSSQANDDSRIPAKKALLFE